MQLFRDNILCIPISTRNVPLTGMPTMNATTTISVTGPTAIDSSSHSPANYIQNTTIVGVPSDSTTTAVAIPRHSQAATDQSVMGTSTGMGTNQPIASLAFY